MNLKGKEVAIFVENNYQELEFWYPNIRMKEEGCNVTVIAPEKKTYKSKLGYEAKADLAAADAGHREFDILIIPGGYAPDFLRIHVPILNMVKKSYEEGKVVAAICHAIWVLISAKIMNGKKATCYHTIKDDLINAGGAYEDKSVVIDSNIITSRQPDDLPHFCKAIIDKFAV